jgi:hypothetical protein
MVTGDPVANQEHTVGCQPSAPVAKKAVLVAKFEHRVIGEQKATTNTCSVERFEWAGACLDSQPRWWQTATRCRSPVVARSVLGSTTLTRN